MSQTKRQDGRRNDETRPIHIVYEALDRVDGSARFGFGQTVSLASLSGPLEVRQNLEIPSHATLEISVRPLASVPGTESRALATTLKAVLSPSLFLSHHPRTLVQIVGQALCGSESGSGLGHVGRGWNASLVASLVNACSAALINAGSVPMKGVVCAVAVGRLPIKPASGTSTMVLDPAEAELSSLVGGGCFVFMFSSVLQRSETSESVSDIPPAALVWTNYAATSGAIEDSEFAEAEELAMAGAKQVWRALKESLGQHEPEADEMKVEKASRASSPEVDDDEMEI